MSAFNGQFQGNYAPNLQPYVKPIYYYSGRKPYPVDGTQFTTTFVVLQAGNILGTVYTQNQTFTTTGVDERVLRQLWQLGIIDVN